ncbi:MAG: DEAD/DEAH box helicase [Bacteroidetes bacterium]|nr:DEAD/DEAH box helicase [Bacteroidota bacterium]MBU1114590.1 DEAD/DEAH box helicase [Bacteroidota bacterium]MBU1799628.1 DEAD/DEAH box helicase [Bacteroidota bacterium]
MLKKILSLFRKKIITKAPPINQPKEEVKNKKSHSIDSKKKNLPNKSISSKPKVIAKPEIEKKWTPKDFPVPEEKGRVRFYDFKLSNGVLHAIADLGFKYCTPIQAGVLKSTLNGKDAIGRAQTGTGKTAAFLITAIAKLVKRDPSIKRLKANPRVLILAPTRELVQQIEKDALDLVKYQPIKVVSVFGGMDYKKQQFKIKGNYIDIMVATPGRLIDFMQQKLVHLDNVELLVLDEADRMLDMGFILDVKKIERATPQKEKRQTLFFSATFPDAIKRFANSWTNEAVTVEIEPENIAADTVTQINYIVEASDKFKLLFNILKQDESSRVLIFCNRKDTAKDLFDRLEQYEISATLLSGDIDQRKRMNRLDGFKEGKFRVLVATDVAGRGIHIDNVSHVINYNLPVDPEDYVHRIGRTGRAGLAGVSISFACDDDSFNIPNIEEYLKGKLELVYPEDNLYEELPPVLRAKKSKEENSADLAKKFPKKRDNKRANYNRNSSRPKKEIGSKE